MHLLPVLKFSFVPDEYNSSESDGNVPLSVSLIGDLGEFMIQVTTATDDSNAEATAIGNYRHDVYTPLNVIRSSCACLSLNFVFAFIGYTNRNILLAGSDYESVQAAVLTYSSVSGESQSFMVTIFNDSFTELREFFEAIIRKNSSRLLDSNGNEINLTSQLSDRITFGTDRARVFIDDINSKEKTIP
jgi:hypothetical protein